MSKASHPLSILLLGTALASTGASAQDAPGPSDTKANYSPYPTKDFPNRVYFGDTHLHTSYSTDAGMVGNSLSPEQAYRFARGEQVTSSTGLPARLQRPYDFLVVSDHSENLGLAPAIAASDPELLKSEWGRKVHDLVKAGKGTDAYNAWIERMNALDDPFKGEDSLSRKMWAQITAMAEKFNEPGRFTAFIGFEWTSMPDGNNLHRNVIFRGGAGHPAQRQHVGRPDVRRRHAHQQEADRPRLRAASHALGAAL